MLGGRTIRVNEVKKNSGKSLNRDAPFRGVKNREHGESRRGRHFSPYRNRYSPSARRSARGHSPILSPEPDRLGRNQSAGLSPVTGRSARRSHSPRAVHSGSFNSSSGGRPRAASSRTSQSPQSSDPLHRMDGTAHRPALSSRLAKEKQMDIAKVREELDRAVQGRQGLEDKVAKLTSKVEQAKETVSALQSKSQKLEESLNSALASSTHRHHQLRNLQKGILQVRDSTERLKNQEKDLKELMAATIADLEGVDGDTDDREE